jgi:hypothetical protein
MTWLFGYCLILYKNYILLFRTQIAINYTGFWQ